MSTSERTVLFHRGLEEWELNVEYDTQRAEPDVGIFGDSAMIVQATFYNENSHCWQPFALLQQEIDKIEALLSEDLDDEDFRYEDED